MPIINYKVWAVFIVVLKSFVAIRRTEVSFIWPVFHSLTCLLLVILKLEVSMI
jgi:hypothetical protein